MNIDLRQGDCLDLLRAMPDQSVDLVITSPPYEDARLYGDLDFKVKGKDWVDWAVPRYMECLRVCKGLVAWVVEGKTKNGRWSATPMHLAVEIQKQGACLRKPPIFHRVGIPGGGGRASQHKARGGSADWWRNDYELIVCATLRPGLLPWAHALATGKPPKYGPGGAMSNRRANGERMTVPYGDPGDDTFKVRKTAHPKIANPGNIIAGAVGGGALGSALAHENEAPFPEWLVEPFVKCFCPPGGTVLDPFIGSGTTAAVALLNGRHCIGLDARQDQIDLSQRRVAEARERLAASATSTEIAA